MNKKKDKWNLLFSAFLVTAFLICAYFFVGLINDSYMDDLTAKQLMTSLVFAFFGLILFYATRVGDGKQIKRFSLSTLLIMVLPSLYIILAAAFAFLPFHAQISSRNEFIYIAGAVLGYGIPYTFLSGYEIDTPEKEKKRKALEEDKTAETINQYKESLSNAAEKYEKTVSNNYELYDTPGESSDKNG
ncbi:MAG: hypothetical protein II059_13425 [Clostridia bacterium]|nr:hypothetical protein [Clostridia bacterium]